MIVFEGQGTFVGGKGMNKKSKARVPEKKKQAIGQQNQLRVVGVDSFDNCFVLTIGVAWKT